MLERVPWDDLEQELCCGPDTERFRPGDHVTLIGPTDAGKTTLAKQLLWIRDYVVVLACKPRDPLLTEFKREGYFVVAQWPPPEPRAHFNRIVYWPPVARIDDHVKQRDAFRLALMDIYETGDWTVYLDDARMLLDFLNLRHIAELFWLHARSLGISFVVSTQRPAWIPLSAYDQATHLFVFHDNDERNVRRLVEMAPMNPDTTRVALHSLQPHQFVYFNTRTGRAAISKLERVGAREVSV